LGLKTARHAAAWLRCNFAAAAAAVWLCAGCRELLYLAAIFFQGGAGGGITGFVNNMRQWLWIPVSQDAYR
jgi:hypothetical protein